MVSNLEISRAERLDMRVVAMMPELTRSAAAYLIANKRVTVNDEVVVKAGYKLKAGDNVHVEYDKKQLDIPNIDLPILYEDDNCVVLEKPTGLLTHSKGAFNPEATVATWLGQHLACDPKNDVRDFDAEVASGSPHNPRAGIVHRLDRPTSGVIICAKNPAALRFLQKQFSQRNVKKIYVAIITGQLDPSEAIIDMPIERNPKSPATFRVGSNGKAAQTHYKTLETSAGCSLLELRPETGRTHQLRVHLAEQHHPIVGDVIYGGAPAERLFLHAQSLEITLPGGIRRVFTAPLPSTFQHYMEQQS